MNSERIHSTRIEDHRYSEREIEYLRSLIDDYTRKLLAASDNISRFRRRRMLSLYLGVVVLIVSGGLWYYWLAYESLPAITIPITASAIAMSTAVFWVRYGRMSMAHTHEEFDALRMRFADVVRLASQIEDHGAVDSIHRIALRLSLAEAEGALRISRY